MLILIPGATGNLGVRIVRAALKRGHQVRALGRSPSKLPADLRDQLESFIEITSFADQAGFERGCAGAEAVIVAWNADPRLVLEGQLALLRAAEKAGIRRFHALSWNTDWEKMPLGTIESYDPMISFARQAQLTSPIKPLYVFCGALAMTLFAVPGAGSLEGESAVWKRKEGGERVIQIVGEGAMKMQWTTEDDVADFSVALVTSEHAAQGGYYRFCSDEFSMQDLRAAYEKVRGATCEIHQVMDLATCRALVQRSREEALAAADLHNRWEDIIGLMYAVMMEEGTWNFRPVDAERFPGVPRTQLEAYIRDNDWI